MDVKFHPALDILPLGQFAHRRFAPQMWGETSIDVLPHVHGAKHLCANRLWGEISSVGWNVHEANRTWGKTSMGRTAVGQKVYKPCHPGLQPLLQPRSASTCEACGYSTEWDLLICWISDMLCHGFHSFVQIIFHNFSMTKNVIFHDQ